MEVVTITNSIILFSALLNIILLIGVRNLLKQNEQLEDQLTNLIEDVRYKISNSLENMRRIDSRGMFEKDDEVGASFDEIKKVIQDLDNEI